MNPTLVGPTYSFEWNTNPPQTTATATNLASGEYFVTISDQNGCIQIRNVKIDSVPPPELNATLTQPSCGQADGEIAATVSNGTAPFSFVWNSSTNTTSTETGLVEGFYDVTVTDSIGCTDSQTYPLAQLPPESEITISAGCLGEPTSFSFNTNSGATSWTWDLGDGTSATDAAPTHTYSSSGDFDISLSLTGGCMPHVVYDTATVYAPPTAGFVFAPETPTTRDQVAFTPTGTDATIFNWDFGDGTSIIDPNPTHQFLLEGFYDIELTVTDDNGCEDTTSQTIEVLLEPVIYFPNAFLPNGTYENKVFKGYGIGVTEAELSIFNRWGTLVYFSASSREILLKGWDGTFNGKDAPQDVYAFKLKASFYNNTSFEKLGTVTLIR
jgi:gliding motility-associated-like protein